MKKYIECSNYYIKKKMDIYIEINIQEGDKWNEWSKD